MTINLFTWTMILGLAATASSSAQVTPRRTSSDAMSAKYANLPMSFEPNVGQTSSSARFISRGRGYTALLTSDGLVLTLRSRAINQSLAPSNTAGSGFSRHAVQLQLLGANKNPVATGERQQLARVNYFLGKDPAKWRRNVPTYSGVRYMEIYPGTDLRYYGTQGHLEYDFLVKAGADAGQIRFQVQGANQVEVEDDGNLLLQTDAGELQLKAPQVYQETSSGRIPIAGGYVLKSGNQIGFQLAPHDPTKPVVIDPVLIYSTYLGGEGNEQAYGVAIDASGNSYVVGSTDSTDFPVTAMGPATGGVNHVFVEKLDPTGSNLIFCDYLGGSGEDDGYALALDAANHIFITGSTASSDFPLISPFQASEPSSLNAFLVKISADGSTLLYSSYFGGNGSDVPVGVAVDVTGNMILAGYTSSTNLPLANAYQSSVLANQTYGFISKFSPDGSSLVYSTYFGGNSNVATQPWSTIAGMALDSSGNVYVAGTTNTYNFPVTSGAYLTTNPASSGVSTGFLGKFSSSGNLVYSTYFGGDILTEINAIAVDSSGSPYITGVDYGDGSLPLTTTSICNPNVDSCQFAYVTKFDATGSSLVYSTFLGPNNLANPYAIVLDANNDAYVVALNTSGLFTPVNGIETTGNLLLAEIDPVASSELFATYIGGSNYDQPSPGGMALDAGGNIYIVGATSSTDFPVTTSAFQSLFAGNTEGFLVKVGSASAPAVSLTPIPLSYSSQALGSTSPAQTVLLRNMGSSPLAISSITTAGDFSESDNCGNNVPAAASCTFSISFTPTAPGSRNGSVAVQDDAAGAPHTISMTGIGLGAAVGLTPASLTFSNQAVGTSSAVQTVALSNTGNASLGLSGIQISGDFSETNNCPASLAPSVNCTISVKFTPTVVGSRVGTITIADNAFDNPQTVALTGIAATLTPSATLSPASLTFPSEPIGSPSTSQTISVTNTGVVSLSINKIQIAGDFSQTNNCPANLTPGSNCSIQVTFTPTSSGSRTGALTITDNGSNSPQVASLSGTGADFSLTTTGSSATIKAGSTASYTVKVTSVGGAFMNLIKLSCAGAPANSQCSLSGTSVAPGSSPANVTVTVSTTSNSSELQWPAPFQNRGALAYGLQLPGLGLVGILLVGTKRSGKRSSLLPLGAVLLGLLWMAGCAGGTGIAPQQRTKSGTYTITVSGSSGSIQHTLPLTLVVQ
jgi:hypothetical protein